MNTAKRSIFIDFQIRRTNTGMATAANIDSYVLESVSNGTQNISPYSQTELPCKGRACAKCGKCRDWYWTPAPDCDGGEKFYMKRADGTCTGCWAGLYNDQLDCDSCFGGGSYYHWFFGCCCFGRHCECDDNRS